jgi:sulfhydrogenase subunit beta (sulfur reductase)
MEFINHEQLRAWLASLASEGTLIAPVQAEHGVTLYRRVAPSDALAWSDTRTTISPKEFFFPATEAIVTIERIRQSGVAADGNAVEVNWAVQLSEPIPEGDRVLFGVRPCDAHALIALDALLLQEPVDVPYARRRQETLLVGVACEKMGPSCFCTSLDFTPDDAAGMDLMLYPVDGGYAVAGGGPDGGPTERGAGLLAGLGLPMYAGPRPWRDWPSPELSVAPRPVWAQVFNDPYWSQLADRCLSCKICAYVCPTCRCFDVRDDTVSQKPGYQKIERLRCWDSCMAEGYRRIAGGHNPRAATGQRLRNRFYCKFDYYPADFGPLACTGCGRCVDLCPVNVDITEIIREVTQRGSSIGDL